MEYKTLFEVLPLTPGPFVKAPAMVPFRPILHMFEGRLCCHTQTIDGALHEGVYSPVENIHQVAIDTGHSLYQDEFESILAEYSKRVQEYIRHFAVVTIRYEEEPMGFIEEEP